jgi:hypothetical protein
MNPARHDASMPIALPHSEQPAPLPTELRAADLRFQLPASASFQTTAELSAGNNFIGQEWAEAALELGLGILSRGFHLFVSGLTGADKLDALQSWVAQHASQAPTPDDWVYVHNFAHPDAPRAIALPAGQGCRLQSGMQAVSACMARIAHMATFFPWPW